MCTLNRQRSRNLLLAPLTLFGLLLFPHLPGRVLKKHVYEPQYSALPLLADYPPPDQTCKSSQDPFT